MLPASCFMGCLIITPEKLRLNFGKKIDNNVVDVTPQIGYLLSGQ